MPTREGYTFAGWLDQLGNEVQPGERVTSAIDQKTTLTAQWVENIDLTVNVKLNHKGNAADNKHQVALDLLRDSVRFDSVAFDESTVSYSYDAQNDVTTYSVTYTDLPQAVYRANPFKSGYQLEKNQRQGEAGEDQTIDIALTYSPDSVDLEFAVKTVFTDETAHLIPRSVNVNVAYWNGQSWVTFPDQTQSVPVKLDADGTGTGVYTVYQNYGADQPYAYRLEVVSFEMPDGRTVNAAEKEAAVTYVSDGSGLYTTQITVEPDGSGSVPNYGSGTSLPGANVYEDGQDGIPTATITITPYTVTFEAMEGLLEGQQTLVLENQYRYPDLESYVPVANDGVSILEGWYLDEARTQRADNLARQYLTGNVTYYAKYSPPMTVQGTVTVEGTYEVNGQQVSVNAIDKVKEAVVVLERQLGGSFVEVRSQLVSFGSYEELGAAQYLFENVPNDGSEYRIRVEVNNYTTTYDNESDADLSYTDSEYIAVLGDDSIGYLVDRHPAVQTLKAISSNYPDADALTDVYTVSNSSTATRNTKLNSGGVYYARSSRNSGTKYVLTWGKVKTGTYSTSTGWYFINSSGTVTVVSTSASATVSSNGRVGSYYVYTDSGSYRSAQSDNYQQLTDSVNDFEADYLNVLQDICTEVSTGVVLDENTMLRDIMGQGFVLPQGAVITAYSVAGTYVSEGNITWSEDRTQLAQLSVDGTDKTQNGIAVKNLTAENATKPLEGNYLPHTVEYTGFDFSANYLNETKQSGYKLVLEITGVEATDDVQYGRPVFTNSEESALLLAEDAAGNRQQLMTFPTPSTIFIQRVYVLDYGKEFNLSGWYLTADSSGNGAVHLDCDVENGMNRFDASAPNKTNSPDSPYGNTSFGNVTVNDDKTVTYDPVTMSWSGWDPFYVFGRSGRRAVLAQDANQNGNLWHKVTVIPANNVYYEDSFVTSEVTNGNGFDGFTFTGSWETVYEGEGGNQEQGEYQEGIGSGVHGWTDDLADDTRYTDGSAHYTAEPGAAVEFTFTGTGVDVYSRTNSDSGMVIATLYQQDGDAWTAKTGVIQNDAASGGVLSVTQLRTTNADAPVEDGGILPVEPEPALLAMRDFGQRVEAPAENTTAEQIAMRLKLFTKKLFTSVRVWLVK